MGLKRKDAFLEPMKNTSQNKSSPIKAIFFSPPLKLKVARINLVEQAKQSKTFLTCSHWIIYSPFTFSMLLVPTAESSDYASPTAFVLI